MALDVWQRVLNSWNEKVIMIKRLILIAALAVAPLSALAQEQPVFKDYDQMRNTLDELMMSRQIARMLGRFGGADEMTEDERADLETRMRVIFPMDFKHKSTVQTKQMHEGWSQEMYAYWTGLSYVWVTVLLHQRESDLVVINIKFNTDFFPLNDSF